MPDVVTTLNKPSKLQRFLPLWFLLAVVWLIIGKSLIGGAGWVTAIMLITVAPFLLVYGLVLWAIVKVRFSRSKYLMSKALHVLVITLLANVCVFGFVIVDGGDTLESGRSALTSLFGVDLANGAEHPVMNISQWVTGKSIFLGIVLLPTVLVMSLVESRGKNTSKPKIGAAA
ncbi:MAG: hypothetical protein ABIR46_03845 [Candidatus Saccharimonadales bacterium]